MGVHPNVDYDRFPRQGDDLGRRVEVVFRYRSEPHLSGVIVRDDAEEPWRTFIRLDDGRFIQASECQYHVVREG